MNERDTEFALKCRLIAAHTGGIYADSLQAFADFIRADEREVCAKVYVTQQEQEPVAWGYSSIDGEIYDCISPAAHADAEGDYKVPLYTAPPQRTWVGLSDEEINGIAKNYALNNPTTPLHFARAIEAKLKKKNS